MSVPMGCQMLRSRSRVQGTLRDLVPHIPTITITSFTIRPGSPLAGTTPGGFKLRKRYNLLVLAIRRGDEMNTSLSGETRLEAGDTAIIYASPEYIAKSPDCSFHRNGPGILPRLLSRILRSISFES